VKRRRSRDVDILESRGAGLIDFRKSRSYLKGPQAQVAELVDALDSGSSARKGVEVRVFSWAPSAKYSSVFIGLLPLAPAPEDKVRE